MMRLMVKSLQSHKYESSEPGSYSQVGKSVWDEMIRLTIIMGDAGQRRAKCIFNKNGCFTRPRKKKGSRKKFHEAISGQCINLWHQYISNYFFSRNQSIFWSADISVKSEEWFPEDFNLLQGNIHSPVRCILFLCKFGSDYCVKSFCFFVQLHLSRQSIVIFITNGWQ